MALRAILKTDLVDLYDTAESWKNTIVNRKKQYDQESRNITKKRKQQQQDQFWDLSSLHKDGASQDTLGPRLLLDPGSIETLEKIQTALQKNIPEVVSRIEFASDPLFLEINRGFFLPICTIVLGALARIRVALPRIGHVVLDMIEEVQRAVSSSSSSQGAHDVSLFLCTTDMAQLRKRFTEVSSNEQLSMMGTGHGKERIRQLLQSIGITDGRFTGKSKKSGETAHDESRSTEAGTGADNTTTIEKTSDNKDPEGVDDEPSHDMGQLVFSLQESEEPASARKSDVFQTTSRSSSRGNSPSNMMLLSSILSKKNKSKKRETKNDNSIGDIEDQSTGKKLLSSPKESISSSKKEKKKKRKKRDFFDDLFD